MRYEGTQFSVITDAFYEPIMTPFVLELWPQLSFQMTDWFVSHPNFLIRLSLSLCFKNVFQWLLFLKFFYPFFCKLALPTNQNFWNHKDGKWRRYWMVKAYGKFVLLTSVILFQWNPGHGNNSWNKNERYHNSVLHLVRASSELVLINEIGCRV